MNLMMRIKVVWTSATGCYKEVDSWNPPQPSPEFNGGSHRTLQLFAEVMTLPKNRLRKSNLNTPHLRAHFSANSGLIDMILGIGAPGFTFWFHIQIPMGQESSGFKKIDQELNENGQSESVVRKTGNQVNPSRIDRGMSMRISCNDAQRGGEGADRPPLGVPNCG
ncbi:hypothetical protein B0H17DRAFT_1146259 [Mycena rosella]|uniref:Uncharacterized protein n=1 Tax=Mycena rosella TaxID=1033263 RepID=A0AAD7CQ23_MYCRO|nr:hypothetical protein B0H17DRAFT_1146259 [Mycena rosella]